MIYLRFNWKFTLCFKILHVHIKFTFWIEFDTKYNKTIFNEREYNFITFAKLQNMIEITINLKCKLLFKKVCVIILLAI